MSRDGNDLDPDRTRVRAEAARTSPTPVRAVPTPLSLEDMSLNMATSLSPAAAEMEQTTVAPERVVRRRVEEAPPQGGSLAVTLSAASAIFLAIALAVVVIVGQKRIGDLSMQLSETSATLRDERAAREAAERHGKELDGQISDLGKTLKERETSLDKTTRTAEKLRETGEKTKSQLQTQIDDLDDKLKATTEELQDEKKGRAVDQENARSTIEQLQSSVSSLGEAKSDLEREREQRLRELAQEKRANADLAAENRKVKDDASRADAAIKRLQVQVTQANDQIAAERARRKALEDQLRRNGLTPEGSNPPPPRPPRGQDYGDDGDVQERDLNR